jgi:hypothetical protein
MTRETQNKERLIAAAPEMLELLQRVAEKIDYGCSLWKCPMFDDVEAIHAVIAKATGEEGTE